MSDTTKPRFEVDPSVVYQLGESLISDAVQALIELVKNSYDACATYAKVTIDTKGESEIAGTLYPPSGGRIIVEDDGSGMTQQQVTDGWLRISNRHKRALKEQHKTIKPCGRTPLGDKGLGRLGVQRLGNKLEVFTKATKEPCYHFGFAWSDFATAEAIGDVDIHFQEDCKLKDKGTHIVISELKELETWRGAEAVKRLEQELSRMISPYAKIRDFMVHVIVDGKTIELSEITTKVRALAPVQYEIRFDGTKLVVNGKARLDFFRPANAAEQFALLVESDHGDGLYNYMAEQKIAQVIGLSRARSKDWYVQFRLERMFEHLDKIEKDELLIDTIANPGPFFGEVDSFDLGDDAFQRQSVFDRRGEYRQFVQQVSGIRVYRDGFGIRVDQDWLRLGGQWTSAKSYYGLKPNNTIGYIALTARENMRVEETTDREGFKDTPYYRNFYALLSEFKNFTGTAHDFFGRASAEYRKKLTEQRASVDSRKTVEDISRSIKNGLVGASDQRRNLEKLKARLVSSTNESRAVSRKLAGAKEVSPALKREVEQSLNALEPLLVQANDIVGQLHGFLEEIARLQDMGEVLEDRVESIRRQMDDMYETVALGLTAEALSHEVFNVADQLAQRTRQVQSRLIGPTGGDRAVLTFIEYVNTAVSTLRKQMSFLSPALRYVREKRHELDLKEYLGELAEFYRERLTKNEIDLDVVVQDKSNFRVSVNQGKLTQVLDNLILNSEYWLKEAISKGALKRGRIVIEVERPFLRVSDNGLGIEPSIEEGLFEPFISAKAKGEGRGLGLFIVKQLLDSESCSIGVLPVRNREGRLFTFQIDLRGVLHE